MKHVEFIKDAALSLGFVVEQPAENKIIIKAFELDYNRVEMEENYMGKCTIWIYGNGVTRYTDTQIFPEYDGLSIRYGSGCTFIDAPKPMNREKAYQKFKSYHLQDFSYCSRHSDLLMHRLDDLLWDYKWMKFDKRNYCSCNMIGRTPRELFDREYEALVNYINIVAEIAECEGYEPSKMLQEFMEETNGQDS